MSATGELSRDQLNADGQQLYDEILAARGSIAGPFRIWLHSPEFTRRATQLGEFLRYHTSLPPWQSELVILITGRQQQCPVEWAIHEPLARKAGTLHAGRRPTFTEPAEEAVYEFCTQLHQTHTTEEALRLRLVQTLGIKAAVEFIGLCGYYTMVAMTLNAFAISADDPSSDGGQPTPS